MGDEKSVLVIRRVREQEERAVLLLADRLRYEMRAALPCEGHRAVVVTGWCLGDESESWTRQELQSACSLLHFSQLENPSSKVWP